MLAAIRRPSSAVSSTCNAGSSISSAEGADQSRYLAGLLFRGLGDGTFMAYDDTILEPLWKINFGADINAPPLRGRRQAIRVEPSVQGTDHADPRAIRTRPPTAVEIGAVSSSGPARGSQSIAKAKAAHGVQGSAAIDISVAGARTEGSGHAAKRYRQGAQDRSGFGLSCVGTACDRRASVSWGKSLSPPGSVVAPSPRRPDGRSKTLVAASIKMLPYDELRCVCTT
jgi:hypothetical protein